MARWSDAYKEDSVIFLCVSVEGLHCARYFAQFVGSCINAMMLPNELPSFPIQLGCSGFVVIDHEGTIVTTRTTPKFLDMPEEAFLSVEETLNTLGVVGPQELSGVMKREDEEGVRRSENKNSESLPPKPLPPVGHCEMDQEHGLIDDCLSTLFSEPTRKTLQELRDILQKHFSHEESLLLENEFGVGGVVSAYESHKGDHERLLQNLDSILLASAATNSVSKTDIKTMSDNIYQHGDRFDSLYAKKVSCPSCQKVSS